MRTSNQALVYAQRLVSKRLETLGSLASEAQLSDASLYKR